MNQNIKAITKLISFLEDYSSNREFALVAGISPQMLSNLLKGRKRAGDETKLKIYRATNGAITPNDWLIN